MVWYFFKHKDGHFCQSCPYVKFENAPNIEQVSFTTDFLFWIYMLFGSMLTTSVV
jgi:hypothetical protein